MIHDYRIKEVNLTSVDGGIIFYPQICIESQKTSGFLWWKKIRIVKSWNCFYASKEGDSIYTEENEWSTLVSFYVKQAAENFILRHKKIGEEYTKKFLRRVGSSMGDDSNVVTFHSPSALIIDEDFPESDTHEAGN
jgi:hypothetical protein